jgi:hypothetical protein
MSLIALSGAFRLSRQELSKAPITLFSAGPAADGARYRTSAKAAHTRRKIEVVQRFVTGGSSPSNEVLNGRALFCFLHQIGKKA